MEKISKKQKTQSGITVNNRDTEPPEVKLEPCLFLRKPVDDTLWNLSIFISKSIDSCLAKNYKNADIEIEARLGKILTKNTRERVQDDSNSESIFAFNPKYCFDPNMSMEQHGFFNQLLNHAVKNNPNLKYLHSKSTDTFYDSLRITTDDSTNIKTCIQKIKVSEIHIRSPNCEFDFRISVNLEVLQEIPKDLGQRVARLERKKDRLSYNYQLLAVDLTQVTSAQEKMHELEVEFKKIPVLVAQKKLADAHSPNSFCSMVEVLLNTLRMLNRKGKYMPF